METTSERPGAMLALGLPATAAVVAAIGGGATGAALAAVCAGFAGVPAAFWLMSTGRRQLWQWLALGAMAGAVPLLVPLAAAVLKESAHGHPEVLRQGVGFIVAGMLDQLGLPSMRYFGRSFFAMELTPMSIGAITAAVYWGITRRAYASRDARRV